MRKPNFFIVGQPKSGTTALYYFLKQHPDVFMPEQKEPWFFCTDIKRESDEFFGPGKFYNKPWQRDQEEYIKLYQDAGDEKALGEATTVYLFSKEAAKNIYDFNPEAKVIALLREPVNFLYSFYHYWVGEGRENAKTFEQALRLESERKKGKNIPVNIRFPSELYYSERINYAQQVKRYLDLFGRDKVKVVIYEDYREDNKKVYKEVLDFLGVDNTFLPEFGKINITNKPRNRTLHLLVHSLPLKKWVEKAVTPRIWRKIVKFSKKILLKPEPRPKIDPELRKSLMKEYKHEVEKISELLDIDLVKKWGYDKI